MSYSHNLDPIFSKAQKLLIKSFGKYLGSDPRGYFNINCPEKTKQVKGKKFLGSFDAWDDRIKINIFHDPIATAIHELLHANSFSDDWLPEDIGKPYILSFRGLEIQLVSKNRRKVKAIYHRGINESVTELFTLHAFKFAMPAYNELLPLAKKLIKSLSFSKVANAYFKEGWPELEGISKKRRFNLDELDKKADDILFKFS